MPTYEYRCPAGHEFEKFFRTISGAPTSVTCPTCGVVAERQLSGGAGLMFKGSGFYLTDYGKNAHSNRGSAPKPAASEGAKSDAGSSGESKSESAGTAKGGDASASPASGGSSSSGAAGGTSGPAGGSTPAPKPKPE